MSFFLKREENVNADPYDTGGDKKVTISKTSYLFEFCSSECVKLINSRNTHKYHMDSSGLT